MKLNQWKAGKFFKSCYNPRRAQLSTKLPLIWNSLPRINFWVTALAIYTNLETSYVKKAPNFKLEKMVLLYSHSKCWPSSIKSSYMLLKRKGANCKFSKWRLNHLLKRGSLHYQRYFKIDYSKFMLSYREIRFKWISKTMNLKRIY